MWILRCGDAWSNTPPIDSVEFHFIIQIKKIKTDDSIKVLRVNKAYDKKANPSSENLYDYFPAVPIFYFFFLEELIFDLMVC